MHSWVLIFVAGWWFVTFVFFHILGIVTPTDQYFSEGLKPPTMWISHDIALILGQYPS